MGVGWLRLGNRLHRRVPFLWICFAHLDFWTGSGRFSYQRAGVFGGVVVRLRLLGAVIYPADGFSLSTLFDSAAEEEIQRAMIPPERAVRCVTRDVDHRGAGRPSGRSRISLLDGGLAGGSGFPLTMCRRSDVAASRKQSNAMRGGGGLPELYL